MSDKKRKVPKLRFPGFTDDWEQRKLGEVIDSFSGGTPSVNNASYYGGNIPFIRSGEIKSETTELYLTEEGLKNSSAKLVEAGDILYALYGATSGEVAISRINGAINQAILAIRPYSGYSSKFLLQWLQLQKESIIEKYIQGGQGNLSGAIVKGLTIDFAQSIEQDKIGILFDYFDNLISLHQRKLDNIKMLKKSLLQKLFPKDGEKIPELRFPGFTDAWEQRKLIDYLEVSKEKNKDGTFDKEDVLSVSGFYGIVNQIEFQGRSFAGSSVANYGVVKNGDVVYTKSPLKSNPYGIIKTNKGNPGVVSTLYAVYRPLKNTHSDFIQTYFEQDARMNNYMSPLVNKGAKNDMKVSDENALKGEVIFPSKEEQVKISDYFDMLNKLLSLHQRKLDHLKELKKGLLQQMFV